MTPATLKEIALELASIGHVRYWLDASSLAPKDSRELMAIGASIDSAVTRKEAMNVLEDQGFGILRASGSGFVMLIEKTEPKKSIAHPVIAAAYSKNEFGPLEDGYQYWFPSNQGALDARALMAIAEELNCLNEAWNAEVRSFFQK